MNWTPAIPTRTPIRVLLTIALTLALLPMLSTFAPGGQVAGFTTASPAAANKVWYQSVGRASATAACEESTTTELAQGWTDWAPSWDTWVNSGNGGFVCNRHITWAFDSVPEGELTPAIAPASQSVNATANSAITATTVFTPTNFTGIPTYTYAVLPTLPTGLSLNSVTGVITGTPTSTQSSTSYAVTATSGSQSATATVIITVSVAGARVPTFGAPSATTGGFTVAITNFDAAYTWTGTATTGSVAIDSSTGVVTVTGVAPGTSSTVTVNTIRTGYTNGSASVSATSTMGAALVPTFGTPSATADGFTVQITNFDAAYTWAGTATASGSVAINGAGLVTVTGVASSTPSTLTVTTTRTGYATGSATVTQTSAAVTCATGGGAAGTCVLGATGPGGGKVFYVDDSAATGSRYMEAAPNTWNGGSADPGIAWCSNTTTSIAGTFGTAIGTGNANTNLMAAGGACTSGAANSARAYAGGGLTNWFLPSKDELVQLYTRRADVGGFADYNYWSSSQSGADNAWLKNFTTINPSSGLKKYSLSVRPVRAF